MNHEAIKQAGTLLQYALRRPPLRATDQGYSGALRAYMNNPEVRDCCQSMAEGLGLRILDVDQKGMYLASNSVNSAFRLRLKDVSLSLDQMPDRRVLFTFALTTIAGLFYQNPAQLESELTPFVDVQEVRSRLHDIAQARVAQLSEEDLNSPSGIDEACLLIVRSTEIAPTGNSRHRAGSLPWAVELAFSLLLREGFVDLVDDRRGGTYRAFSRFRAHVRDVASFEAYRLVTSLLQETGSRSLEKKEGTNNA